MNVPENAPNHCPGTESSDAGKASACAGCPNQKVCASGEANVPDPDQDVIHKKLSDIKNIVIVLSGKGGVGKSTFTAMLSRCLASKTENETGVLDIDICGPSQPRMFGVVDEAIHSSGSGWSPVYVSENLSLMSIGFLLDSPEDAVIWRGPKKNGMIKQFIKDVDWGELDYLVIDTPPGTSDEHMSLAKYLSFSDLNHCGAIILSTPQEVALLDVRKEITFCQKVKIPIIGVVENMSSFVCPKCDFESVIFPKLTGGAQSLADEFKLPFLGHLPIDAKLAKSCDQGSNLIENEPNSPLSQAYLNITKKITDYFEKH